MSRALLALAFLATATLVHAQSAERAPAYDGAPILTKANPPAPSQARGGVLFDQTDLVTSVGTGPAGTDESGLQTALTMTTFGAGHSLTANVFVADDFTVPAGETWDVTGFNFYAYQTGGTTTCSMTGYYVRIWDGPPGDGGTVIAGDRTTNLFQSCTFSGIYRVRDVDPPGTATTRPIYESTAAFATPLVLPAGTYWVDWAATGSLASGPWVPPVTIVGQTTTGNARQEISAAWANLQDGGSLTPQGLPFQVLGTSSGGGSPLLSVDPTSVPFGSVGVGGTGGPATVTLTNTGTETLTISSISLSGDAAFSINTAGTSLSLAPSAATTFTASFTPTAAGAVAGSVTITSNAPDSPATVALSGTGTSGGAAVTFPSTDTPVTITDNTPSGVTSTITIPASETRSIADLDVDLNATHSWIGDLAISLARDATTVSIMDRPGYTGTGFGCSGDNPNIIADDEGTDGSIEGSCVAGANPGYAVADGRYTPNQPLSAFDGSAMAGTYTLTISDNAAGDTGTLDSWALIITPEDSGPSTISMVTVRQPAAPLPSSGGDARIAFRFTNLTNEAIATTTWAELEIPGGGLITIPGDFSRLMRPKPLPLAAAGDPADNRRWGMWFQLLPAAPAGEYRYTRYAGTQGGTILVSETVAFTKAAPTATATAPARMAGTPDADEAVVTIGENGAITVVHAGATEALTTSSTASGLRVSPNPMTTQGQAVVSVATTQDVRVSLYDALGREVRVLLDRSMTAGQEAHIGFRTNDLPAGVYVIRATGTDFAQTERITVVR